MSDKNPHSGFENAFNRELTLHTAAATFRLCPESFKKGNIKNLNGEVIGVHDGIINFTIGQRKGIKVSDKEALYAVVATRSTTLACQVA